jgi:hypothetical protein
MVGSLEALIRISHARDGFPAPSAIARNAWTYLPVVLTILVGWFWQSYDVEVKKIAPWGAMARRPQAASNSVLLDYVEKNMFSTVVHAVYRRHWQVLLTGLGTILVIVANVAAASLWTIEPRQDAIDGVLLSRSSQFDLSTSNQTVNNLGFLYKYIAGLSYSLPVPDWSTTQWALAPFNIVDQLDDADVTTQVRGETDAYGANLLCDEVNLADAGHVLLPPSDGEDVGLLVYQVKLSYNGCEHVQDVFHCADFPSKCAFIDSGRCQAFVQGHCANTLTSLLWFRVFNALLE